MGEMGVGGVRICGMSETHRQRRASSDVRRRTARFVRAPDSASGAFLSAGGCGLQEQYVRRERPLRMQLAMRRPEPAPGKIVTLGNEGRSGESA